MTLQLLRLQKSPRPETHLIDTGLAGLKFCIRCNDPFSRQMVQLFGGLHERRLLKS